MNIIDILLSLPLLYGLVQGFRHGLVREIGALIAVVIGIYVAHYFSPDLAKVLSAWVDATPQVARIVAYSIIFLATTAGVHFVAYLISKILDLVKLGTVNKCLGAFFGTVKWLLILSIILKIISMAGQYLPIYENSVVANSKLFKPVEMVIDYILPFIKF